LLTYVTTVALTAAVVAVVILVLYPISIDSLGAWGGVLALMALTIIGEGLGVRYGAGRALFSVSLIPTVATVPLFGPSIAIASTAVSQALARSVIQKQPPVKSVFNVAQLTLAIGLGAVVYHSLGGPVYYGASGEFRFLEAVLPLGGLIGTYFVANMALVSAVIALDTGKRMPDIWRELGPVAFANELASSSFSLFVVFAFAELGPAGPLVVVLPLVFIHHAYGVQFKLLKQNKEILELLVKTIEAKDPYTSGHSVRVASLSRELAEALGVSSQRADEIETAALLHDIGKIDFAYTELINSPAKLTVAEREIIRSHPERGARLLASISSLSENVLAAVRHHHEHYDGNGYPDGLAGEEIPLAARIIMVVDTVDAMLSNRPYRAALSVEEVTSELRRYSGRQFDPVIAAKFIELGMVERAAGKAEVDRTPLPVASMLRTAHASVS
jgi:putative nucleotidyltransferase with HDIG domain